MKTIAKNVLLVLTMTGLTFHQAIAESFEDPTVTSLMGANVLGEVGDFSTLQVELKMNGNFAVLGRVSTDNSYDSQSVASDWVFKVYDRNLKLLKEVPIITGISSHPDLVILRDGTFAFGFGKNGAGGGTFYEKNDPTPVYLDPTRDVDPTYGVHHLDARKPKRSNIKPHGNAAKVFDENGNFLYQVNDFNDLLKGRKFQTVIRVPDPNVPGVTRETHQDGIRENPDTYSFLVRSHGKFNNSRSCFARASGSTIEILDPLGEVIAGPFIVSTKGPVRGGSGNYWMGGASVKVSAILDDSFAVTVTDVKGYGDAARPSRLFLFGCNGMIGSQDIGNLYFPIDVVDDTLVARDEKSLVVLRVAKEDRQVNVSKFPIPNDVRVVRALSGDAVIIKTGLANTHEFKSSHVSIIALPR